MSARAKALADALRIFREPAAEPDDAAVLPQVRAARERDRLARARLKAGGDHRPTAREALEERAWKRRGRG